MKIWTLCPFLQQMALAVATQLSFPFLFWEVNKVGHHGGKLCATSHRLNLISPTALEVRNLQAVYDPNSDLQCAQETWQLCGQFWLQIMLTFLWFHLRQNETKQNENLRWYSTEKYKFFWWITVCSILSNNNVNQAVIVLFLYKCRVLYVLRSHWTMVTSDLIPTSCTSTGNQTPVYLLIQLKELDH